MKKLQFYLSGFLALQLVLATGLFWREHRQQEMQQQREPLLAVETGQIEKLEISDGDASVTLRKQGDTWLLPELEKLPANADKLDTLLEKLQGLRTGWPVATTDSSRERFEVAEDRFRKRLRLYTGGEKAVAEFYLGTSPGFRKIHLRSDGDDAVYAVELSSFEWPAKAADWLDKKLLAAGDVEAIDGPDYRLAKRDGKWQFDAGEAPLNSGEAEQLADALKNLRVSKLAAKVPEAEPVRVKVTTGSGELDYEFLQADEHFYVRRGDREQLFELSRSAFDRIAGVRNEQLVLEEKQETERTAGEEPTADSAAQS
ncbi:DUF4340 domain-containing protein [Microbulbifer halophilus]|uniref:DUF4340 domain-containing protein n=1 Tax=Microbulbifer halophilus TaxID=453963 RepID=A0ABW5E710_9GAMM|nr:DUF4340 domain-containing protein [Microbulbifer halophilus]MCW8127265.1 DUF4340 domain-containing protein [Microbulbifer halophilus]